MIPQGKYRTIYGYNWYGGKGSQESLLKIVKDNERIVKMISHNIHLWTIIKEQDLLSLTKVTESFLSEILHRYPKKVFFDLDITPENNKEYFESFDINNEIKYLKELFETNNVAVSGSNEESKKSYHITIPEYILKDSEDEKKLKYLVKELRQEGRLCYDDKVYTPNRMMKCINQRKDRKRAKQEIILGEPKDHFICSYINKNVNRFDYDINEEFIKNKCNATILHKKPEIIPTPISLDFNNINMCDLLEPNVLLGLTPFPINQDHSYTWKVFLFSVYNGIDFDTFWKWASTKDNNDSRYRKWKKYWDDEIEKQINIKYRVSLGGYMSFLGNYYQDMKGAKSITDVYTNKFISSFNLQNITKLKNRIEINHFKVNKKAIIFNIGMGGGKTTSTIQYIKETNQNFIWITPRTALANNTEGAFNRTSITNVLNYKKIKNPCDKYTEYNKANNLIIQAESLHYLNKDFKKDLVIIDEIETVLNSWISITHQELEKNFNNFCRLIQSAKKVILLDAFITHKTIDFLNNIGITDYIIYEANYKPKEKFIEFLEADDYNYLDVIDKIAEEINSGNKIYLYYPFKKPSKNNMSILQVKEYLERKCKNKLISPPHTGDSTSEQKAKLANVNEYWSKYDCVIVNGAITVGVNYDIQNSFDKIYMFASSYCGLPRDLIQASMRIRDIKDPNMVFYCFSKDSKKTFEHPEYYHTAPLEYKKLVDNIRVENMANWSESFKKFCEITNYNLGNKQRTIEKKLDRIPISTNNINTDYPYDEIDLLTDELVDEYITLVETDKIDIEKSIKLKKYYFDKKYSSLTEEDRKYLWNKNAEYTFDNLKNEIIEHIKKDNGVSRLIDVNLKKIQVSEETNKIMKENYNCILKAPIAKVEACVNSSLRTQAINSKKDKQKHITYFFSKKLETIEDIRNRYDSNKEYIKEQNNKCNIELELNIKEIL